MTDTAYLFRGDHTEYPERLWPWALALRDEWLFTLPNKPQRATKREKSRYGFWILAMDDLKLAAAEFGLKALHELRTDFCEYMAKHNGLAPYTVAGPQSLINVMYAKVALMRARPKAEPQDKFKQMEKFLEAHYERNQDVGGSDAERGGIPQEVQAGEVVEVHEAKGQQLDAG